MNRIHTVTLVCLAFAGSAFADITVNVSPAVNKSEFEVRNRYIQDMVRPRMDRPEPIFSTAKVENGKFVLPTMPDGNAETTIYTGDNEVIVLYTRPGDNLIVTIDQVNPLNYSTSGSQLAEDISKLDMAATNVMKRFQEATSEGKPDEAVINKFRDEFNNVYLDYLKANPGSDAAPFAVMQLEEAQDFMNAYASLAPSAFNSPIAPLLESQKIYFEKAIEAEKRLAELQSGNVDAPDFTFKNVDGHPVSLSDFKGKWVVIDFWGTWCPWCIKGFPELKAAYEELKPKLEILGVACNEKNYEVWEKGLKKYELPWVNVYNPVKGGGQVLEDYAVQGFPTKVIVTPEGKIANITVGENPEFFDILRNLVK